MRNVINSLRNAHKFQTHVDGTGFFVTRGECPYVVTASSVLLSPGMELAQFVVVEVEIDDGTMRQFPASILGLDRRDGVAVLQIQKLSRGTITPLEFETDTSLTKVGQSVVIIGNSTWTNRRTGSVGYIRDNRWNYEHSQMPLSMVLVDVPSAIHSNGSPIIGPHGHVVGMYTDPSRILSGTPITGLAADHLSKIVHQIIEHHAAGMVNRVYNSEEKETSIPSFHTMGLRDPFRFYSNRHERYVHLKSQSLLPPEYRWVDIEGLLVDTGTNCGIKTGDIVTHINGVTVGTDRDRRTIGDVLWYLPLSSTTVNLSIVRVHTGVPQYLDHTTNVIIQPDRFDVVAL